jgi:quinohemoprotein ethanol dehydrogenase
MARSAEPTTPQGAPPVDTQRLTHADAPSNVGDWMSYSRTWDEQRYSPLAQINDSNVSRLGLAWYDDLETQRGVQASPLVIDGVLYNESIYNIVTAYDGRTGRKLWTYDPKVGKEWARLACCGPSARGIAAWKGKIIIGALDGRLIAIDARTGKEVWTAQTFDRQEAYSITGAPRVYDGKVIIGNGGADYGVRGFVTAWDAETGKKLWKFYTVPGDPSKGPDGEASDSIMATAAKTWTGDHYWKFGGGGTAWDSFAYDPKLNLVYIGTGNGSVHMQHFRSPEGGDNLFLCSIVAVDATTGQYKWHYQMVPGEEWDYTCTQPIVLADLKIGGKPRQVLMQAPKNGFIYVIDRKTGTLIDGKSYVSVNTWASHIDKKTGRPVEVAGARNTTTPHLMNPSWMAAHSWHPMSYSPKTGLLYWPAQEQGSIYARTTDEKFKFVPGRSNSGQNFTSDPELRKKLMAQALATEKGYLIAWNPVTMQEAYRIPYVHPGSGGVLTTAGNLLIQGTIDKTIAIYRADTGKKLWEMKVDNVGIAGPITYSIGNEQYIAINVGWGGSPVYNLSNKAPFRWASAKLLVFKLDAKGVTLPPMPAAEDAPAVPQQQISAHVAERGEALYGNYCVRCHGDNAVGGVKDLRKMSAKTHAAFMDIVLKGARLDKGMPSFAGELTPEQAEELHGYLITRAQEDQ